MTTAEKLCVDCERRPAPKDGSRERCHLCYQREEDRRREEAADNGERKSRKKWSDPLNMGRYCRFYVWKSHLVGFTHGITDTGQRYANQGFFYLNADPSENALAKLGGRLVDMNIYQSSFDYAWVKRFKAMVNDASCLEGTRLNWDGCQ